MGAGQYIFKGYVICRKGKDMKRILVIEDEEEIVKVLVYKLKQSGFEVDVTFDSIMAVKAAHDHKPDLILLDMMLPGGGGIIALKNIRMATQLKFIPVIVLTGMKNEEKKSEIEKMGIAGYFEKPYDFPTLLSAINELFNPSTPS